jgi:ABC-type phosphate transport system substrate-binding protein
VSLAVVALLVAVCPDAREAAASEAPGFVLVVHPENPTSKAPRQWLASLFLKEATRWSDDVAARPVDLKPDAMIRRRFSESVLKRSVAAVKSFWQQRIFSGRGVPPPELESDQAVIHYVTTHRGAVGYVASDAPLGKARIVRIE